MLPGGVLPLNLRLSSCSRTSRVFRPLGYDVVKCFDRPRQLDRITRRPSGSPSARMALEANPDDEFAKDVSSQTNLGTERYAAYTRDTTGWGLSRYAAVIVGASSGSSTLCAQQLVARQDVIAPEFTSYGLVIRAITERPVSAGLTTHSTDAASRAGLSGVITLNEHAKDSIKFQTHGKHLTIAFLRQNGFHPID